MTVACQSLLLPSAICAPRPSKPWEKRKPLTIQTLSDLCSQNFGANSEFQSWGQEETVLSMKEDPPFQNTSHLVSLAAEEASRPVGSQNATNFAKNLTVFLPPLNKEILLRGVVEEEKNLAGRPNEGDDGSRCIGGGIKDGGSGCSNITNNCCGIQSRDRSNGNEVASSQAQQFTCDKSTSGLITYLSSTTDKNDGPVDQSIVDRISHASSEGPGRGNNAGRGNSAGTATAIKSDVRSFAGESCFLPNRRYNYPINHAVGLQEGANLCLVPSKPYYVTGTLYGSSSSDLSGKCGTASYLRVHTSRGLPPPPPAPTPFLSASSSLHPFPFPLPFPSPLRYPPSSPITPPLSHTPPPWSHFIHFLAAFINQWRRFTFLMAESIQAFQTLLHAVQQLLNKLGSAHLEVARFVCCLLNARHRRGGTGVRAVGRGRDASWKGGAESEIGHDFKKVREEVDEKAKEEVNTIAKEEEVRKVEADVPITASTNKLPQTATADTLPSPIKATIPRPIAPRFSSTPSPSSPNPIYFPIANAKRDLRKNSSILSYTSTIRSRGFPKTESCDDSGGGQRGSFQWGNEVVERSDYVWNCA